MAIASLRVDTPVCVGRYLRSPVLALRQKSFSFSGSIFGRKESSTVSSALHKIGVLSACREQHSGSYCLRLCTHTCVREQDSSFSGPIIEREERVFNFWRIVVPEAQEEKDRRLRDDRSSAPYPALAFIESELFFVIRGAYWWPLPLCVPKPSCVARLFIPLSWPCGKRAFRPPVLSSCEKRESSILVLHGAGKPCLKAVLQERIVRCVPAVS